MINWLLHRVRRRRAHAAVAAPVPTVEAAAGDEPTFLRISECRLAAIRSALLPSCGREHKLYAFLGKVPGGFVVGRVFVALDQDYERRTATSVVMTALYMKRVQLAYRWLRPDGVLELHSHPFSSRASFSHTDDYWIGGVRSDFGRMHASGVFCRGVFGQDERGFSLEYWDSSDGRFRPIADIQVVGREGQRALRSWRGKSVEREAAVRDGADALYQRTAAVRTPGEHAGIREAKVVLIGAGGTGCECARLLAGSGVGNITIVDGDRIEPLNLNRLVGATPEDAALGVRKAEWLAALLQRHDPSRAVRAIPEAFPSPRSVEEVQQADLIVAAVDSARVRHDILRLAARHLRPVVDCGTSITLTAQGNREERRNGHVWFYVPGEERCFHQMGLGGPELWATTLQEAQREAGYVLGVPGQSPGSVQIINAAVASVAMALAEAYLLGRAPDCSLILFDQYCWPRFGFRVAVRSAAPSPDCPICGMHGVEGQGGNPFEDELACEEAPSELPPLPDADTLKGAAPCRL